MILQCTVVNELKPKWRKTFTCMYKQLNPKLHVIFMKLIQTYINYWHIHIYMFSFGKLHFNDNFLSSNINQEADHSLSNKALHTNKMLNRKTLLLIVYWEDVKRYHKFIMNDSLISVPVKKGNVYANTGTDRGYPLEAIWNLCLNFDLAINGFFCYYYMFISVYILIYI